MAMDKELKVKVLRCGAICLIAWLRMSRAQPSVSLTVEGGGNDLVGDYCPGTVRLSCNAIALSGLVWTYNGGTQIAAFFPDSEPDTQPQTTSNIAFPSVLLNSIFQDPDDPDFANFSSTLIVDLFHLEAMRITDISCGDGARNIDSVPVNVTIIEQRVPDIPRIDSVTATYESGVLQNVAVQWLKLDADCGYGDSLVYTVNLTNSGTIQRSQTDCVETLCTANFNTFDGAVSTYMLSIVATNTIGSSGMLMYPYPIERHSETYISPQLDLNVCEPTGWCGNASDMCTISYSTDPSFVNTVEVVQQRADIVFRLSSIASNTTYYFMFKVQVESSLMVIIRLESTSSTPAGPCNNISTGVIIGVITLSVLVLLCVIAIVVVFGIYCYQTRWKGSVSQTRAEEGLLEEGGEDTGKKDISFKKDTTTTTRNTSKAMGKPQNPIDGKNKRADLKTRNTLSKVKSGEDKTTKVDKEAEKTKPQGTKGGKNKKPNPNSVPRKEAKNANVEVHDTGNVDVSSREDKLTSAEKPKKVGKQQTPTSGKNKNTTSKPKGTPSQVEDKATCAIEKPFEEKPQKTKLQDIQSGKSRRTDSRPNPNDVSSKEMKSKIENTGTEGISSLQDEAITTSKSKPQSTKGDKKIKKTDSKPTLDGTESKATASDPPGTIELAADEDTSTPETDQESVDGHVPIDQKPNLQGTKAGPFEWLKNKFKSSDVPSKSKETEAKETSGVTTPEEDTGKVDIPSRKDGLITAEKPPENKNVKPQNIKDRGKNKKTDLQQSDASSKDMKTRDIPLEQGAGKEDEANTAQKQLDKTKDGKGGKKIGPTRTQKDASSKATKAKDTSATSGRAIEDTGNVPSWKDNITTAEKPPEKEYQKEAKPKGGRKAGSKSTPSGPEATTSDAPGTTELSADKGTSTLESDEESTLSEDGHNPNPQDTKAGRLEGIKSKVRSLFKPSDGPSKATQNKGTSDTTSPPCDRDIPLQKDETTTAGNLSEDQKTGEPQDTRGGNDNDSGPCLADASSLGLSDWTIVNCVECSQEAKAKDTPPKHGTDTTTSTQRPSENKKEGRSGKKTGPVRTSIDGPSKETITKDTSGTPRYNNDQDNDKPSLKDVKSTNAKKISAEKKVGKQQQLKGTKSKRSGFATPNATKSKVTREVKTLSDTPDPLKLPAGNEKSDKESIHSVDDHVAIDQKSSLQDTEEMKTKDTSGATPLEEDTGKVDISSQKDVTSTAEKLPAKKKTAKQQNTRVGKSKSKPASPSGASSTVTKVKSGQATVEKPSEQEKVGDSTSSNNKNDENQASERRKISRDTKPMNSVTSELDGRSKRLSSSKGTSHKVPGGATEVSMTSMSNSYLKAPF